MGPQALSASLRDASSGIKSLPKKTPYQLVFYAFTMQSLKISLTHIVLFYFTFHVNKLPQAVPEH